MERHPIKLTRPSIAPAVRCAGRPFLIMKPGAVIWHGGASLIGRFAQQRELHIIFLKSLNNECGSDIDSVVADPMKTYTILIIDDHPMMRTALRIVLECEPDLEVTG